MCGGGDGSTVDGSIDISGGGVNRMAEAFGRDVEPAGSEVQDVELAGLEVLGGPAADLRVTD